MAGKPGKCHFGAVTLIISAQPFLMLKRKKGKQWKPGQVILLQHMRKVKIIEKRR